MEKEVGEQERGQPAVGKAGRGGTVNTVGGGGGVQEECWKGS